jgi:hypothetical protein
MNLPTIDSLPNYGGTANMNFGDCIVRGIAPIPSAVLYADKKRTKKGIPITVVPQKRELSAYKTADD